MTAVRTTIHTNGLAWAEGSLKLAEVVRAQQGHLQSAIARLEHTGAEDIHQGRVAARRLRSVLKTFGPLFDARWARLYRMDLRSFARGLATVREADVHSEVLQEAIEESDVLKQAEIARLSSTLRNARGDVRERLARRSREHGWKALMKALAARSEQPPRIAMTDVGMAEVLKLADGAWRKAARLMKRHPVESDELHELRLALKHCRYALEVVADVEPKQVSRLLRRLRRAQEAIGAHRDTIAAAHWVRSHERELGRATVARIEALLVQREMRLRRAAARQSERVLPAYREWRTAIRPLRKAGRSGRA
jgi:CHAD domain-containing protein